MLFEEYDAEKALEIRGQEEFEKGKAEGEAKGETKGILKTLVSLFKKGMLTLSQAAEEAKMTPEEFQRMAATQQ